MADSVLGYITPELTDLFTIGRTLGEGRFGTTCLATEIATGIQFACKSISKTRLNAHYGINDIRREIEVMHLLSGQRNIVKIKAAYEDLDHVHIVMDFCKGGELFERLEYGPGFSEGQAAEMIGIIVGVVEACHAFGVMHRDLKPENFMFFSARDDLSLRAIDFGLSVFFKPGESFTEIVGSEYYIAPEALDHNYGPEVDVWAAGVILYILLGGALPFIGIVLQETLDKILKGKINFESDPWPTISGDAKDLITKMLCPRPSDRLTAHQVLCHPWIRAHGIAPNQALDTVLSRLKQFSGMNKLKKMALWVIADELPEVETAGLKAIFRAMDKENNGAITFGELKAGLGRYDSSINDSEISILIDAVDVDENGTIDSREFIAATLHHNKLENEGHLQAAFKYFDKERSDYITLDNLRQAFKDHNTGDVLLQDIIKEVDLDNDGHIGYGEFVAMMQKVNVGPGMEDAPGGSH